jgi:CheY-like chemotaxis protein
MPKTTRSPVCVPEDESWLGVHEEPTLLQRERATVDACRAEAPPLVLVVDDNRDNRDFYVDYLQFMRCRVLAAENGLEGLRIARACRPDLIVMDVSMPVMDGCEMAQRIRADVRTRAIPIVAVTCFGPAWQEAARTCGCEIVLEKPTALSDLESAIGRLLPRRAEA